MDTRVAAIKARRNELIKKRALLDKKADNHNALDKFKKGQSKALEDKVAVLAGHLNAQTHSNYGL
ncbi:hypothetical protein CGRA01v4_07880 [Colletotrichum graminicola]|nr:hypothetical protein CGRA01v4_07880 [Colletotrichum graminicola]